MTMTLCQDNLLDDGTVAASSEDADYPAANAYDWQAFSSWSPTGTGDQHLKVDAGSAVSPDYYAVMYHNQGASAVAMDIEHSSDDFSADINSAANWSVPAGERGIEFGTLSSITKQHWRLKTNATHADFYIKVLAIGDRLDLPVDLGPPFTPPHLGDNDTYLINKSLKGTPLGDSIISYGWETKFNLELFDPAWIRSSFEPFRQLVKTRKFILVWDLENYPDEAALAWPKKPITIVQDKPIFMSASFDLGCLIR